jgi:tetraacyldisaccharide 4'-kinase
MNAAASLLLLPLSAAYGAVMRARSLAYKQRLLSVKKLKAPVISVGNLTTGGTGKTPLVEWVCRTIDAVAHETAPKGKRVCVLTRGYGRVNPETQVVVSNGNEVLVSEIQAGDEPFLLANSLLGVSAVICNPDRVAAGRWAMKNLESEIFVLDDAFQHQRLFRDLDIVTVDATDPWRGGLLPRGHMREPSSGLARADCIVITRTEQVKDVGRLKETIQKRAGKALVVSSRMVTAGFRRLDKQPTENATLLSQPIAAFCGVGNPNSFFEHLRGAGYHLVVKRSFSDHHNYKRPELDSLVVEAKAAGATSLLTTAKDATKLQSYDLELPCSVLDIQISIDEEDRLVDLIRQAIRKPA